MSCSSVYFIIEFNVPLSPVAFQLLQKSRVRTNGEYGLLHQGKRRHQRPVWHWTSSTQRQQQPSRRPQCYSGQGLLLSEGHKRTKETLENRWHKSRIAPKFSFQGTSCVSLSPTKWISYFMVLSVETSQVKRETRALHLSAISQLCK